MKLMGLALACAILPLTARAAVERPAVILGAAWYPEQWPESRWPENLSLMEAAYIHAVRVGEFARSRLEPREASSISTGWIARWR
jgi:beta-galactosidase